MLFYFSTKCSLSVCSGWRLPKRVQVTWSCIDCVYVAHSTATAPTGRKWYDIISVTLHFLEYFVRSAHLGKKISITRCVQLRIFRRFCPFVSRSLYLSPLALLLFPLARTFFLDQKVQKKHAHTSTHNTQDQRASRVRSRDTGRDDSARRG